MASMDGMCRPDMYQYFVFVDGVYAGTLSPRLMDSRSDESAVAIRFPAPGKIAADFTRYSEKDPMCCPSRMTELTFEIAREKGKAVVSWIAAKTRPSDY